MTEQEAVVLLNAIPGLGSVRIRQLIAHFGSARAVLNVNEAKLARAEILPSHVIAKIFEFDRDNFLQSEYNLIRQYGVHVVTIFEEHYPAQLKTIHDPPTVLYVRGALPDDQGLGVGVVGSRKASIYGITIAEKFSAQLAELGITIVSGLARGVDTAAHQGCLKTGGKTVAVLGCGLAHIYPEENRDLSMEIGRKGAVISEFPMGVPPIAFNFPARNRIISGLSMAVLVVEASLRSGALITSDFALEQGRDVFAIPGKIDQPNSQGVNQLIKQGAKLVTCFEDILQELEPQIRRRAVFKHTEHAAIEQNFHHELSESEAAVVETLTKEPIYIDELAERCGHSFTEVANILLALELKKIVKQLPGKYFVRM